MYLENVRFSLWADFIERQFLEGEFVELIGKGIINGATSNPAIFKNAILTSGAYREQIAKLRGQKPKEIYEALAITDIQRAADKLLPLYRKKDDGFVSIEVDPHLCDDAKETVYEAKRLYKAIGRENVMIKIPATEAGFEVISQLVGEAINVNATLIFSPLQAKRCLDAVERGQRFSRDANVVLSVFVSRLDRKLDPILAPKGIEQKKAGILNAAYIYNMVQARGLENTRTLFASTGVKGNDLRPSYYVEELLAPNSINTAPIETIHAFVKRGSTSCRLPLDDDKIKLFFDTLEKAGIGMQEVYSELMEEGLEAFKEAFDEIMCELEGGYE